MATHLASPHNSHAPQNTENKRPPSQEDIGSVLERFHKWAGRSTQPVRELSYEEAFARSRRRSYAEQEPAGPQPVQAAAAPVPAPPPPIPFPVVKEPPAGEPASKPSRPASAKSGKQAEPATPENPSQHKTAATDSPRARPTQAGTAKKTAPRKKKASAAGPGTAQKKSPKKSSAKAVKDKASTTSQPVSVQPSPNHAAPAAAVEAKSRVSNTAASAYARAQPSANAPEANPLPQATFAQVLAEQFDLPEVSPAGASPTHRSEPAATPAAHPASSPAKVFAVAPLPDDAPAVHLTVRLASNERESLRERARDLGVTPSAYVRQCALEVDSLRTELDHTRLAQAQVAAELALAREDARSARSEAALCISGRATQRPEKESDWFKRLRNFVFPRKAKGQAFATHA